MRFLQQIQYHLHKEYIKISVNSSNISDKVGKPSVSVCEIKSCESWRYMEKRKDTKSLVEHIFTVKNSETL